MIYLVLLCLYTYLIIKVLLSISPRGQDISKKFGTKISLIEFFAIAIVLAYLFNYYYLQTSEFESFIIPVQVIWMSFASALLLFGIAIGARFVLSFAENFISSENGAQFNTNKQVYDIFSLIWLNISVLMIFFSYSLMEISRPIERIESINHSLVILGLSGLLGILFYFMHKEVHFLVKRITIVGMGFISLCLVLFTFESKIDFVSNLPFTTSFILFNLTFFISLLASSIIKYRKSKLGLSPGNEIQEEERVEQSSVFMPAFSRPQSNSEIQNNDISINLDENRVENLKLEPIDLSFEVKPESSSREIEPKTAFEKSFFDIETKPDQTENKKPTNKFSISLSNMK